MQIKDRVWYITGAASGLGAATAELLHSKGGYVALLDLNLDAAKALEKKLGSERAHAAQVDVTSEEDVVSALESCDKRWPDVVPGGCLNAGGVGMAGKTINQDGEPFDLDTFKKVVEINVSTAWQYGVRDVR